MWLGGFGFFATVFGLIWLSDPASKNPAVNRMAMMIPDPADNVAEAEMVAEEEEEEE